MKSLYATLLLLFSLGRIAGAQPAFTARAELTPNSDYSKFTVWPLPDSTVVALVQEPRYRRNLDPFSLVKFNNSLVVAWQFPLDLPEGSKFLSGRVSRNTCYFLFQGEKYNDLVLARVNLKQPKPQFTRHTLPEGMTFRLTDFQELKGKLFLTGLQNDRLVGLHLDPSQEYLIKLPAIYDQASALTEFFADTVTQRMEFILAESNGLKSRLQTKRLGPDGRLYSTNFLQNPDRSFLSARLSPGDSSRKLIMGTYSNRDLRYAQGIFTGPFLSHTGKEFRYYAFTSFMHFFDYLRPTRQEKLRRKIARFKETRKQYQLRQRMLLHSLRPYGSGYLMVGELYQPHYQGEGAGNRIFDGYEFTQALVMATDSAGTLLWENSLPLQNVQYYDVQETVAAGTAGDKVMLCYLNEDKIRYKTMQSGETTPNAQFIEIGAPQSTERVFSTDSQGLTYWYGNHFLTYGTQQLRGTKGARTVFYLNKLSF